MPQDLIGCRKHRKLKALIPRVVVFVNDQSSVERRIEFAVFFIVLWSYGRKICLNMCYGNSENSCGCSYLLRICFIYGKWVYRGVEPSASCWPLTRCISFTNKRVQIKILSILKLVSFESLARNDVSERGMQAEAHCERNLNANCEVLDEKYRITVQGIFSVHRLVVWLRFC